MRHNSVDEVVTAVPEINSVSLLGNRFNMTQVFWRSLIALVLAAVLLGAFISSANASGPNFNDTDNKPVSSVSPSFSGTITLPGGAWSTVGNVGIGSASPQQKLDVEGTVYFGTGNVGIGSASPVALLNLAGDGGIIAAGTYGSGATLSVSGVGTRMMWYPRKAAFRVGYISGTQWNDANIGGYSMVLGHDSQASGIYSAVSGGCTNTASGQSSHVGGGYSNTASGSWSVVPGGQYNTASANYTLAAGHRAKATAEGAFALADSTDADFTVATSNAFGARFSGGYWLTGGNVGIGSTSPQQKLDVEGTVYFGSGNIGVGDASPDSLLDLLSSSAANTYIKITNTNAGDYDAAVQFEVAEGTPSFTMGVDNSDSDKFKISTTALGTNDRLVIDASGNVGVGDASPDSLLDLLSSSAANTYIKITNTNAGDYDAAVQFEVTEGTPVFTVGVDDSDADKFKVSTTALGTNDRLVIDADGNVGVGSASPVALIDVNGTIYGHGNVGIGTSVPAYSLDTLGTARFGGATNYAEFEADGTLVFNGGATVWGDLAIPGMMVRLQGTSDPSLDVFRGNTRTYAFANSAANEVFIAFQLPHSYKEGTDIYPYVHFAPNNTNRGYVRWCLEYSWANVDDNMPTTTTSCEATAASGTQYDHQMGGLGTLSGTGKTMSSVLVGRLYRDGADAADTYNDKAFLLSVDVHFEQDTIGSHEIMTK